MQKLDSSNREDIKLHCSVSETVEEACRDADIICTVTSSTVPLLFRDHVKPGQFHLAEYEGIDLLISSLIGWLIS